MNLKWFLPLFLLSFACKQHSTDQKISYARQVGDIAHDPGLDDPTFKPCRENQAYQYYQFGKGLHYKGEKIAIIEALQDQSIILNKELNGYVTIRFMVNCQGRAGRFRMECMDRSYKRIEWPEEEVQRILNFTKSLQGWEVHSYNEINYDYYQYLTYKLSAGKVIDILP